MDSIFWKVKAQSDGISSPTIPFDPISPGVTVGPTSVNSGPAISLVTDETEIEAGQSSKIGIFVNTDGQDITQYSIQITYNSNLTKVLDSDPLISGIQVDFLDTFFEPIVNEVNQQTGIITIVASNPIGENTITNRKVAEIDIEAISQGFADFNLVEDDTSLLTSNSINIVRTLNNLSVTITGDVIEPTLPQIDPTVTTTNIPGQTPVTNPSLGPTGIQVTETPKTAITDNISTPLALVLGVIMVSIGSYIYKIRNEHPSKKI